MSTFLDAGIHYSLNFLHFDIKKRLVCRFRLIDFYFIIGKSTQIFPLKITENDLFISNSLHFFPLVYLEEQNYPNIF